MTTARVAVLNDQAIGHETGAARSAMENATIALIEASKAVDPDGVPGLIRLARHYEPSARLLDLSQGDRGSGQTRSNLPEPF